ncbi:hypothetical protein [Clostridium sp. UBA1056]|uniref:hypothetical protein n=1 Tax=unclassified Clostridium TaxID=2614128 RepID=UPI003216690A
MYYIVPENTFKTENEDKIKKIINNYSNKYLAEKKLYLNIVLSNENGLLYELKYNNFTSKDENIGDIMIRFSNLLINDYNVYLALYCGTLEFFKEGVAKNYVLLTEEILFENMTLDEKKKKLDYYIKKIGTQDKELLIIDGYLFAKNSNEDYKKLLRYLLEEASFSKLNVITKQSNFDEQTYDSIVDELKDSKVYFSDGYHDRFWIADYKKGFATGSSLNGIGKKVCRIDFLEDDEVKAIVNDIKNIITDI